MDVKFLCILNVLGGIYGLVMCSNLIPAKPYAQERMDQWRRKFGPFMKICSVASIMAGAIMLFMS